MTMVLYPLAQAVPTGLYWEILLVLLALLQLSLSPLQAKGGQGAAQLHGQRLECQEEAGMGSGIGTGVQQHLPDSSPALTAPPLQQGLGVFPHPHFL